LKLPELINVNAGKRGRGVKKVLWKSGRECNMKARELAELLLEYPDFEIKFSFLEKDTSEWGLSQRVFTVDEKGIDLGHSDKTIFLGGEEEI